MAAKTGDNGAFALATPSDREIVFTRVLNATRQRVFDAWTRPEHLMQWFGCHRSSLIRCDVDLCVGGVYRFVARNDEGSEYTVSGIYRDIAPPERLVFTQRYDDDPGTEALVALQLDERNGRTTLTMTALYRSAKDRKAILDFGVDRGTAEMFERLDSYLADALAKTPA